MAQPKNESRTLALHGADPRDREGDATVRLDSDPLLPTDSRVARCAGATDARSEAATPRSRRGGRPVALTATALLAYYQEYALDGPPGRVVAWTRSEVARLLRVSIDTIGRREAELIAIGAIRREISYDRQRSSVFLLGTIADVDAAASKLSALQEGAPARGSKARS